MTDSVVSTGSGTRGKLVEAALAEFGWSGFDGTNTNKIARRAGFAPQTFYRHFADKLDVFLAAYKDWSLAEKQMFFECFQPPLQQATDIAAALLVFYSENAVFRASLKKLAADENAVYEARNQNHLSLVALFSPSVDAQGMARAYAALLSLEAVLDAAALGQFEGMGEGVDTLSLITAQVQPILSAASMA